MKKLVITIICSSLLFFSGKNNDYFSSCAAEEVDWSYTEIRDSIENFKLQIPEHLTLMEPYSYFKFVACDTSSLISDKIIHTISVEHYALGNQTFDAFYEDISVRTTKALAQGGSNMKMLGFENTQINEYPAKVSSSEYIQRGTKFYLTSFYIQHGERIFVFSVGTTDNNYKKINCLFRKTIQSLQPL